MSLSRSDYHKHSEYLIRNSDIGASLVPNKRKLAAIVLAHRGNLKKVASFLADRSIAEKILALRLAVILCHAKIDTDLPPIQLFSGADGFMMSIPKNWLTEHPLTEYLLGQEKEIWAKVGIKFEIYTMMSPKNILVEISEIPIRKEGRNTDGLLSFVIEEP